jgi:hypothetical protein
MTEAIMSDMECYVTHCYDLLLNKEESRDKDTTEEELCACAGLLDRQDQTSH